MLIQRTALFASLFLLGSFASANSFSSIETGCSVLKGNPPYNSSMLSSAKGCESYAVTEDLLKTSEVSALVIKLSKVLMSSSPEEINDLALRAMGYEKSVVARGVVRKMERANISAKRIVLAALYLESKGLVYANSNDPQYGIHKKEDYVKPDYVTMMDIPFELDFSQALNDYGIKYSTYSSLDDKFALSYSIHKRKGLEALKELTLPNSSNYTCKAVHPALGFPMDMLVSFSQDKKTIRLFVIADGVWSEARFEGSQKYFLTETSSLSLYLGDPNRKSFDDAYLTINADQSLTATMQYGAEGRVKVEIKDCAPLKK